MSLTDLRCSTPGCHHEICAIEVGEEPVAFGGMLVARGREDRGWCMDCLIQKGKLRLHPYTAEEVRQ